MKEDILKNFGISIEDGLQYLGDISMYNEILRDFFDGFIKQMNDIRESFEKKDIENYTILVHALKSNCRTLGINKLADLAYEQELKGKEKDYDFICKTISPMFTYANSLYQVLKSYFD